MQALAVVADETLGTSRSATTVEEPVVFDWDVVQLVVQEVPFQDSLGLVEVQLTFDQKLS